MNFSMPAELAAPQAYVIAFSDQTKFDTLFMAAINTKR